MKALIFGGRGQLGSEFKRIYGVDAVAPDAVDITKYGEVSRIINGTRPDVVINCAAYTKVDLAEEERKLCEDINADAPFRMAEVCARLDIPIVHFSSDYVFSGEPNKRRFEPDGWREDDETLPLSQYGRTKLRGDVAIQKVKGRHLIFRTSWLYGYQGRNFFTWLMTQKKEKLEIVDDQQGSPTFVPQLAWTVKFCIEKGLKMPVFPSGLYHCTNSGMTSWYRFARKIVSKIKEYDVSPCVKLIEPITTKESHGIACRPAMSRLNCKKIERAFGTGLPGWDMGLQVCVERFCRTRKTAGFYLFPTQ